MNGDSVYIGVVNKPDDLIGEQLSVVLRGEVRLCRLTGVQLQGFTYPLPEDVQGRVCLHDLGHGLMDERLHARDPVTKCTAGWNIECVCVCVCVCESVCECVQVRVHMYMKV